MVLAVAVLLWGLELFDTLFLGQRLNALGIRPRSLEGLRGVLLAPLLHASLGHLLANTVPFLTLGFLVMLGGTGAFLSATVGGWLVGGLGVWLFGGGATLHLGLSIVVFGYLGYLLARAYFERSVGSLVIALGVAALYGGLLWGVLPVRVGVSWQGHLFGLLGGILAARFASRSTARLNAVGLVRQRERR
ncbi:rhomboid family intramembrane serine protease [soil metagenome]